MIVAANWKMNPPLSVAGTLVQAMIAGSTSLAGDVDDYATVQRMLFPPHPFLMPMSIRLQGSGVHLGGQDCHEDAAGAHTGDVSAMMLRDCGASIVLLGHSERRANHGETSALVAAKANQALATGLDVMICVGETLAERQAGHAEQMVIDQLRASIPKEMPARDNDKQVRIIIAYEPVWAIGTGQVASLDDIAAMHATIAAELSELPALSKVPAVPILYGGSVNAQNAAAIFALAHVGGGLVGGASLDAAAFTAICHAAMRTATQ